MPDQYRVWPSWRRMVGITLIGLINAANIASLALLVVALLRGGSDSGAHLILEAIKIWTINVLVYALWYWEIDRGGPGKRAHPEFQHLPDFLFPQMDTPSAAAPDWKPGFVDYLYLSFTNSTAFSPTDTLPLTPVAKMLMLAQSITSLITIALVAARAVNILPTVQKT